MTRRVLIVEDDPASSELLRVWLEMEGYSVEAAADLSSGRQVIERCPPDLILLDIGLGPESGLDLAKWVRAHPAHQGIPMIAVTAHAMVSERQRIFASGCNQFVAKPVDLAELGRLMRRWLPPAPRTSA